MRAGRVSVSQCTLTSAGPYGHCLQTPKNNAAKNRTPALLHCKQGRVGGNYSFGPKARMSKHVTRAHGPTANGEVPVLWVDGGTVAVMPCSRSIRYRAQGGEALREARQTRLTRGYACRRLPRMPASARRKTQLHHRPRQVVRLAQVDPGPEDQHHSNQHEVQLGYSRAAPHIAGSLNLFSERPRGSPLENFARLA